MSSNKVTPLKGHFVEYENVNLRGGKKKEMMIIIFLLTGWILSWFKFDKLFIQAFKELFNKEITIASYYFIVILKKVVPFKIKFDRL
ncbi:hypothetical protein IIM_03955 [Bacillus cereus VD107]|nr:hypothetical protein IIM_03955 [Bacillus cereus VD107]